uniref:7TM_GPCR_Srx domain-containing protein n=1 Tax=Brugia timori TaxID=42155 RepID=A0A0R3QHU4_9BILA
MVNIALNDFSQIIYSIFFAKTIISVFIKVFDNFFVV